MLFLFLHSIPTLTCLKTIEPAYESRENSKTSPDFMGS